MAQLHTCHYQFVLNARRLFVLLYTFNALLLASLLHYSNNFCTFCRCSSSARECDVLFLLCGTQLNLCLLVHVRIINEQRTSNFADITNRTCRNCLGFSQLFQHNVAAPRAHSAGARLLSVLYRNCCRYLNGIYGRCARFNRDHDEVFVMIANATSAKRTECVRAKRAKAHRKWIAPEMYGNCRDMYLQNGASKNGKLKTAFAKCAVEITNSARSERKVAKVTENI